MVDGHNRIKKQKIIDDYNNATRQAWCTVALTYGSKNLPELETLFISMDNFENIGEEQTEEQKAAILKALTIKMHGKIRYIKDDGTEVDPKYIGKMEAGDG